MNAVSLAPGTSATSSAGSDSSHPTREAQPPGDTTDPTTDPAAASTARGRLQRLWRGPASDPRWARPALLGLLAATAGLYLWDLSASGWANSFYSAAVQAGSTSWEAFLFGSSDAGNSITVDKPPAALWLMALSVRLLGLSSFAILLPQALMGVATVGVVYAAVKRSAGAGAGLLAGGILAVTPVAALMFRFNNPDALLTLTMALGAWSTMRAIEKGSIRWMALTGVFIGVGFLTKTLQVALVVPFLGLAFLLLADTTWRRRLLGSLAAVGALVVTAGWWVALVELVPASMRPYVGGSQTNSFLELTFGYNGLGRINGTEVGSVGGAQRGPNAGSGSLLRLFEGNVAGQVSWLLPAALLLLLAGLVWHARSPRTDLRRASYVVWGGWLIVTGLTFSLMQGIFHEYYTVALAPAIAAVVALGVTDAWERRGTWTGRGILALAVATTAVWGFVLLSRTTAYGPLRVVVLTLGLAAAALLLVSTWLDTRALPYLIGLSLVATLAGPSAYTLSTVTTPHTGSIVLAGPAGQAGPGGFAGPGGPGGFAGPGGPGGFGGPGGGIPGGLPGTATAPGGTAAVNPNGGTSPFGGPAPGATTGGTSGTRGGMGGLLDAAAPSAAVVSALREGAQHYRWVAAAIGSQNAAGLQLGAQEPVMAIGGFNGSDPSPTLAQFQQYVADGRIHYFLAGQGFRGQNGGSSSATEISTWVQANYRQVTIGSTTFYDLTAPVASTTAG